MKNFSNILQKRNIEIYVELEVMSYHTDSYFHCKGFSDVKDVQVLQCIVLLGYVHT